MAQSSANNWRFQMLNLNVCVMLNVECISIIGGKVNRIILSIKRSIPSALKIFHMKSFWKIRRRWWEKKILKNQHCTMYIVRRYTVCNRLLMNQKRSGCILIPHTLSSHLHISKPVVIFFFRSFLETRIHLFTGNLYWFQFFKRNDEESSSLWFIIIINIMHA